MGVVRSAKSIIHRLFNLALYKSPLSHTVNLHLIVEPHTVSDRTECQTWNWGQLQNWQVLPPYVASFLCVSPVPNTHHFVWFSHVQYVMDRSSSPSPKKHELSDIFALWFWNPEFQPVPITWVAREGLTKAQIMTARRARSTIISILRYMAAFV